MRSSGCLTKNKGKERMKSITGILAAVGIAGLLLNQPALAGEGKKTLQENVAVEEARKWWGASLSTGWDSLYMFRGVNVLRFDQDGNKQRYGSSLYWAQVNVSFMPTENDTITLGSWMAFGLTNSRYKEYNATVNYVHTFGDLAVGMGYTFYYLPQYSSLPERAELDGRIHVQSACRNYARSLRRLLFQPWS